MVDVVTKGSGETRWLAIDIEKTSIDGALPGRADRFS
jgi:hypothetical protein